MLSAADNSLLTQTGRDTPMGELLRQYWLPALLEANLPDPGGLPLRVRLLGEDLLFYRSPKGEIGLMGSQCPHRGASLYYGRNEENGLRCVYHGWQFDKAGACVDLPNDPRGVALRERIRHTAYPTQVRGGVVWAYMGPASPAPALPDLEWLDFPADQVHISMRVQRCNWLQALEGEIDSSHAGFLHSRTDGKGQTRNAWDVLGEAYAQPVFEVAPSDAGVQIGARRSAGADEYYWRVNQFLMPFWTLVPPSGSEPAISGHAWVPMDDQHTLCFMFTYRPTAPLPERRLKLFKEGARGREAGHSSQHAMLPFDPTKPYGMYWPKWNAENDYGLDLDAQQTKYFSGMAGLWVQDAGLQESMGAVSDRSVEHLCSSDVGIVEARRLLKRSALDLRNGGVGHASISNPAAYRLRPSGVVLSSQTPWLEGTAKHRVAEGEIECALSE